MMATSSSRPGKRSASSRREANPFGWFSDDDQCTDFICQWGYKEVIRHKCMSILCFRNEGFVFQEWLEKSGLNKFVELQGDCYPNLVVKGVEISIDYSIWKYVAGFQQGGLNAHQGIPGFYKTDIYNNFLKNSDMVGKYESFDIKNLRKEECLCAYMITWILLPRGEDRSILNGEDVYLLYTLQTEFVDERFKRLDEKMLMLQRSFIDRHQKMDYALRINSFGDTFVDDSDSGKNSADKKIVESSERE
ncbi:hypothetical protein LR48_Vigan08g086500 [Vigna angularis]|uniref:Uncharacterized protein n=1 Tax=Phaseolus angularis TaxID=3914 RepID=A0A0L9V515_PHAAN|nr:hypothetical protein LR48_Vigan08g086500 [Vigna angularis]